jgi:hypothetical protein
VDGISFTVHPLSSRGLSDPQPTGRIHPIRTAAKRTGLSPRPLVESSSRGGASPASGELPSIACTSRCGFDPAEKSRLRPGELDALCSIFPPQTLLNAISVSVRFPAMASCSRRCIGDVAKAFVSVVEITMWWSRGDHLQDHTNSEIKKILSRILIEYQN